MTFVYFIGLSIVLVPIGLGVSALSQTFSFYHKEVFLFGGIFMLILAIMTLYGKTIPIPFKVNPNLNNFGNITSVFLLGFISGAASSCCTPVLIGVLTITALSGTFFYALLLSLSYVLGMVFPLFILSYFWDKYDFSKSRWLSGKTYRLKWLGKTHNIHSSHLLSALILGIMGILIIILAIFDKTWTSVSYLKIMSDTFGKFANLIIDKSKIVPEYIWAILIILLIILIIWRSFKYRPNRKEVK